MTTTFYILLAVLVLLGASAAFPVVVPKVSSLRSSRAQQSSSRLASPDENDETEADRLQKQAEKLRQQIREMEVSLEETRKRPPSSEVTVEEEESSEKTLRGKQILVAGANGRLGSMVCRYLLRNNPQTKVVAAVHYVGENSPVARGYGRLAYEVGAEDGIGSIGSAWSTGDERRASFQWHEGMQDYNLNNIRVVECDFLDPVQCGSIVESVDAVIWCATDFNGNQPRAISGLNLAFLFRAVTVPDKGRVEIEGVQNMLGALKRERQDRLRRMGRVDPPSNDPINFVLVSTAPEAFLDFETPFGSFYGIKRQGEEMMEEDFPSLTSTILQMGRYEDNFVEEDLQIIVRNEAVSPGDRKVRQINRRDAARAAVEALTNDDLVGQTVQVWTVAR